MTCRIKCKECGKIFRGVDEYEAEVKWNSHRCPVAGDLSKLSLEELLRRASPHLHK